MNDMPNTQNHDRADLLLDDYVMGTLSDADLAWMDAHIAGCPVCQRELPALLEGTYALAWSVDDPEVEPASDLWDRIEANLVPAPAQVSTETVATAPPTPFPVEARQDFTPLRLDDVPRSTHRRPGLNQSRYRWLAAAAVLLVVVGVAGLVARAVWWDDQAEPAQDIAMHDADGNLIAGDVANLEYLPGEQRFVLHIQDLPDAPDGQIYQAWLIAGEVPTPVGIVNPASGEFTVDGDRAAYDAFAITVEPGPEESPLPTTNPIVVAPLDATG